MTEAELEIARSERVNLAFFLRAETASGTVRLFAGAGDFAVAADAVETEGGVYLSAGVFSDGMPDIDTLMNGEVQAIQLGLSGVDTATVQRYLLDRTEVVGAPAALGWAFLDHRYRLAGPVRWPARGYLAAPKVTRRRNGAEGFNRVISVTLMVGPYARRRAVHRYFSQADHRRAHPTDPFCDQTVALTAEATRKWPN